MPPVNEQPEKLEATEMGAAFAARRELGPQYELELAESLADRINAVIDNRLAAQKVRRPPLDWAQMTLGLGSLSLAIPLVAITAGTGGGTAAMLLIFAVIAVVNLAYVLTRALHRRD
ncbi:hypothetical protein ACFHYQ_14325 [Sphaerimonospora cavernae]|uniref:DUF3040 domain-containing protein n=1 Tax=Sphaerimonospora cavernae TaxID=1740611 RepID=A0ABV6U4U3_9ACTN